MPLQLFLICLAHIAHSTTCAPTDHVRGVLSMPALQLFHSIDSPPAAHFLNPLPARTLGFSATKMRPTHTSLY